MSSLERFIRQDIFHICAFITINAFVANFLPDANKLRNYPRIRYAYEVLVDVIAGFSLNWRTSLPSLDAEFIGFKRTAKHIFRNWQQTRIDKKVL